MDIAEQNYTKQKARSSQVKPGFIRLDIFPGKQARELYWALSIQKDALLETAAVNLANEDLDGYFEHLYQASELGETIDDLVLGIIDALDPTERDNTLSLSRRQQMKEDLKKRIFKTSPSSPDTSAGLSPN